MKLSTSFVIYVDILGHIKITKHLEFWKSFKLSQILQKMHRFLSEIKMFKIHLEFFFSSYDCLFSFVNHFKINGFCRSFIGIFKLAKCMVNIYIHGFLLWSNFGRCGGEGLLGGWSQKCCKMTLWYPAVVISSPPRRDQPFILKFKSVHIGYRVQSFDINDALGQKFWPLILLFLAALYISNLFVTNWIQFISLT